MAKIFRNYNTLSQFNSESVHPENKICFIKDNGVIYSNGVQYSIYKMDTIANIGDSDNTVDKFNELRTNLLKSNLMKKKNLLYWTGPSNTISISGRSYTAKPDKVTIDGVEYYQLIIDDSFNDDFCNFDSGTFTNLIFKDVDTSKITNMGKMFNKCSNLTSLDVSNFDTSKVTSMRLIFSNCQNLPSLNLSTFNTGNVTDMTGMFQNCYKLTSLDLSGFDTSNVTTMQNMFYMCLALESLNLSGWDTSNVTNMNEMFKGCSALKTIRMVGCSQTTIDKIKAQLTTDGITDCTIVTE